MGALCSIFHCIWFWLSDRVFLRWNYNEQAYVSSMRNRIKRNIVPNSRSCFLWHPPLASMLPHQPSPAQTSWKWQIYIWRVENERVQEKHNLLFSPTQNINNKPSIVLNRSIWIMSLCVGELCGICRLGEPCGIGHLGMVYYRTFSWTLSLHIRKLQKK